MDKVTKIYRQTSLHSIPSKELIPIFVILGFKAREVEDLFRKDKYENKYLSPSLVFLANERYKI